jgi:hypothetical protein
VAEDLLRAEGFTEISFVEVPDTLDQEMIARGNRKHPVATMSVLRAMLTAADICGSKSISGCPSHRRAAVRR